MADSTTPIPQMSGSQANKEVTFNAAMDAASPAMLYGRNMLTTTGLTWGYLGGRYNSTAIANGTVSLTASSTNYVVAARSNGGVSASTASTNWDNQTDYMRLYRIVADESTVTSYEDHRQAIGATSSGGGGGGGMTNPMTTAGDIITGGTSGVPQRLPAGTNGYVLKMVSGIPAWAAESGGGGGGMTNPMTTAGDIITGGTSGAAQRLAAGTNGYVLTMVGGAPAWAAASGGGGGLSGFTSATHTTPPNDSRNVSSLSADLGSTSGDISLVPKSAGSLQLAIPDGTSTGGNKRGTRAVDLQLTRSSATQVASGNTSFAAGSSSTASGANSVAIGNVNLASGANSSAIGGTRNEISGTYSIAIGGQYMRDRGLTGLTLYGSASNGTYIGQRQGELMSLGARTTNATPAAMSSDSEPAGHLNQYILSNNSIAAVTINVSALQSTGTDTKAWMIHAAVKRGANAAATSILGTPTITVLGADAGAAAWDISVSADTTNGGLQINVTGESGKNINWCAALTAAFLTR